MTAAVLAAIYGGKAHIGYQWPSNGTASTTTLSINADTDFPALSDRTTFCAGADHCWLFGGAGTISDSGSGSWDLTASGTPRTGVETGLPVYSGGAVSWTGEQAAGLDTSSDYYSASVDYSTAAMSVTAIYDAAGDDVVLADIGYTSGAGVRVAVTGGALEMIAEGGTATMTLASTATTYADHGYHCITWVANGASSTIFGDGAELAHGGELAHGTLSGTGETLKIGGGTEDAVHVRYAVTTSALTLADHQALCGSWGAAIRRTHPAYADVSWTQTGGSRCFQAGAHNAVCIPGGLPAYAYDATLGARRYAPEVGRINRVLYSSAIDTTNWLTTDSGSLSVVPGQVAPDGSNTATSITVTQKGVDDVRQGGTGYNASVTIYPRVWLKCTTGTLRLSNTYSTSLGDWRIDCATVSSGQWVQVYSAAQIGVSEITAWVTNSSGKAGPRYSTPTGTVTASIWIPMLTETDGISVIPTGAAAVDTGDVTWSIANATGAYWAAGDTVTTVLDEIAGTCWVTGSTLYLGGDGTPYCTGLFGSVEVVR